jgi:hypothetical protein
MIFNIGALFVLLVAQRITHFYDYFGNTHSLKGSRSPRPSRHYTDFTHEENKAMATFVKSYFETGKIPPYPEFVQLEAVAHISSVPFIYFLIILLSIFSYLIFSKDPLPLFGRSCFLYIFIGYYRRKDNLYF